MLEFALGIEEDRAEGTGHLSADPLSVGDMGAGAWCDWPIFSKLEATGSFEVSGDRGFLRNLCSRLGDTDSLCIFVARPAATDYDTVPGDMTQDQPIQILGDPEGARVDVSAWTSWNPGAKSQWLVVPCQAPRRDGQADARLGNIAELVALSGIDAPVAVIQAVTYQTAFGVLILERFWPTEWS
jgi:hypothetical protein